MAILSLRDVSFSYGGRPLIEQAHLQIERGERVCLVGRNGAGKSTLLKLLGGELKPDAGLVENTSGVRVTRQVQEVPTDARGTIFEEVAGGLGAHGPLVAAHYRLHRLADSLTPVEQAALEKQVAALDPERAWDDEHQVEQTIERMELDPWAQFSQLSSGMKRRVLLARSIVASPDVLLLDEPTNHLDIEAIRWLEDLLLRFEGTVIFVTHDRMFLGRLATRIIEIDRARLLDWTCDYATFLVRKEAALAAEEQQQALFDKKLAVEEAWLRKGVKARRTRNEGRVRALMQLRRERQARREKVGTVKVDLPLDGNRSGTIVAQTNKLGYEVGGRTILKDLTTTIQRGDKVGIIGPNGCGKTTLLRCLLGELAPTSGTVRQGTNLEIAYFDQLRAQLDDTQSALENVSCGQEFLVINGRRRHVIGYLEDFLFSPERSKTLVKYLSGGERNRLLLARLFSKTSNLLVLDEPTNDLDAETMELLEDLLVEYTGTVLVVSHDRAFLNNVVTQTLVYEGAGVVREYDGGYDDWLRQAATNAAASAAGAIQTRNSRTVESAPASLPPVKATRGRALSFKEQKELAEIPKKIEQSEAEQTHLQEQMAAPGYFQRAKDLVAADSKRLAALHEELSAAYLRWEELEARAQEAE